MHHSIKENSEQSSRHIGNDSKKLAQITGELKCLVSLFGVGLCKRMPLQCKTLALGVKNKVALQINVTCKGQGAVYSPFVLTLCIWLIASYIQKLQPSHGWLAIFPGTTLNK